MPGPPARPDSWRAATTVVAPPPEEGNPLKLFLGLTNAELAQKLYMSPRTADHHVSAVLTKLGLGTRREVVRRASELGLV